MAKRKRQRTGEFRVPDGWKAGVRVPWGRGEGPEGGKVEVADVGGRLVPASFVLTVRPPEADGAAITIVYEVVEGVVSNPAVATEGIDALHAADVLRKAMPLEAWAHWAVNYMAMYLLMQQLVKLGNPEVLASALHLSPEDAARAIEAFQAGGEVFFGEHGTAAMDAAASDQWADAMAATRERYERRGPTMVLDPVPVRGTPRRNSVTKQHLREVAAAYRRAVEEGLPPTKTVAETFDASHSTAARWVGMARSEGFLGPAKRGQSGETGNDQAE